MTTQARNNRKTSNPKRGSSSVGDGHRSAEFAIVPIRRETLSVRVAQALQTFVVQKQLKRGDRLPSERQLSQSFQVSIPVIREALRTLESQGVLKTQHGRGIFVHEAARARVGDGTSAILSDVSMAELGTARVAFEAGMVDLWCARATKEDCDELEAVLSPAKSGEPFTVHTDLAFHVRLLHVARNPVLVHMGEGLLRQFFRLTAMARPDVALSGHSTTSAADQRKRHLALVASLRQRNSEGLRKQIVHHLDTVPGFRPW